MNLDAVPELDVIREVLAANTPDAQLLLPALLEVQRRVGHVSNACIAAAAEHFNLSRADVYGVASFYHDLRREPAGLHRVQICQAEACQAVGCRALAVACRTPPRRRDGNHFDRPARDARNGILLRQLRVRADRAHRRCDLRPGHARTIRRAHFRAARTANMTVRVFVPNDTSACSLGADAVADAIEATLTARHIDARVVRNGSRGAYALEPLVEVETVEGRIGFARVEPKHVAALFASGMPDRRHASCIGLVDDLPFLKRQTRLTFARAGVIDPLDLDAYRANGGLRGADARADAYGTQIVDEIRTSGLRGRGGAAFPAAVKWQTVLDAAGPVEVRRVQRRRGRLRNVCRPAVDRSGSVSADRRHADRRDGDGRRAGLRVPAFGVSARARRTDARVDHGTPCRRTRTRRVRRRSRVRHRVADGRRRVHMR